MQNFKEVHHAKFEKIILRQPLISLEALVIFVVLLLINWLGNVAETFTDILKHYVLKTTPPKLAKCCAVKNYLKI